MTLLLRSACGAVLCAATILGLTYALRRGALLEQARMAHESLTYELSMGFLSLAVVLTITLAAIGSLVRWRRSHRPSALRSRVVTY